MRWGHGTDVVKGQALVVLIHNLSWDLLLHNLSKYGILGLLLDLQNTETRALDCEILHRIRRR
jgi:hypothetical protein